MHRARHRRRERTVHPNSGRGREQNYCGGAHREVCVAESIDGHAIAAAITTGEAPGSGAPTPSSYAGA